MELVADENVPRPVIARLRADGHTVDAISEISAGIPDTALMHDAHQQAFILNTHDRDFGELAVHRGLPVTGVILLEVERLSLVAQVEWISKCLAAQGADWTGYFSVIEPARVRRRALTR